MKIMVIAIVLGSQKSGKVSGGIEDHKKHRDHSDHSIVTIG